MKRLFPLILFCLSFIGCSAQTVETLRSISAPGSVLTTSPSGSVVGVDPLVFKGAKGDTGAQGVKGDTGATGAQGPKGDSADIVYLIPGGFAENLNDGRDIATAYATKAMHYIAIAGTVKLYQGTLKIKYFYTDGNGVDQTGVFDVTKTGPFTTGLIPIYTRPTTLMKITTEVTGNVFYDIAYNFHGL